MTNHRALTMTSTLEAPVTPPPFADKNSAWLLELIALLARLECFREELAGRRLLADLDLILWVTEGMVQALDELARKTRFAEETAPIQMDALAKAGTFFGAANGLKRPVQKSLILSMWTALNGPADTATSRAVRECANAAVEAVHAYFHLFTVRFSSSSASRGWVDVASTFLAEFKQQVKAFPAS